MGYHTCTAMEALRRLQKMSDQIPEWEGTLPCSGTASFVNFPDMVMDHTNVVYYHGIPMGSIDELGLCDAAVDIDNLVTLYPDTSNRTGFVVHQGDHTRTPTLTVGDLTRLPVLDALRAISPPGSIMVYREPMSRTSGLPPTTPTHTYGGVVKRDARYFLVDNLGYIIMEFEDGEWLQTGVSHTVPDDTPVLELSLVVWNGCHGIHTRTRVMPLASPGSRGLLTAEVDF